MKTQDLLIAITLFFSVTLSSCFRFDFDAANCIKGEGTIVEREIALSEISKINLSSSIDVVVSQGPVQKVLAVGHGNIIDHLNTNVSNRLWDVNLDNGCYSSFELTVYVTVPEIEALKNTGSGEIVLEDFNQCFDPTVTISGSGNFIMNEFETAKQLFITINSSGSFYAQKQVTCFENLTVKLGGSGSFNGFAIEAKNGDATTSGSGSCSIFAVETLDATITGSGDISYKGTPRLTIHDNGSGNLKQAN
jgi:hypothetical protein